MFSTVWVRLAIVAGLFAGLLCGWRVTANHYTAQIERDRLTQVSAAFQAAERDRVKADKASALFEEQRRAIEAQAGQINQLKRIAKNDATRICPAIPDSVGRLLNTAGGVGLKASASQSAGAPAGADAVPVAEWIDVATINAGRHRACIDQLNALIDWAE